MRKRVLRSGSYFDFRCYMDEEAVEPLLFGYSRNLPASLADARPASLCAEGDVAKLHIALTPAKHLATGGAPARSHPLYGHGSLCRKITFGRLRN